MRTGKWPPSASGCVAECRSLQLGGCVFKSWPGLLYTKFYSVLHSSRVDSTASEGTVRRVQAERMPSCWHNLAPVTAAYYGHTDMSSTLWSIRHARSVVKAGLPWNSGSVNVLHWQLHLFGSSDVSLNLLSLSNQPSLSHWQRSLSEAPLACIT